METVSLAGRERVSMSVRDVKGQNMDRTELSFVPRSISKRHTKLRPCSLSLGGKNKANKKRNSSMVIYMSWTSLPLFFFLSFFCIFLLFSFVRKKRER